MGDFVFDGIVVTIAVPIGQDHAVKVFVDALRDRVNRDLPGSRSTLGDKHVHCTDNCNGYVTIAVLPSGSKFGWPSQQAIQCAISDVTKFIVGYPGAYVTRIHNGPDAGW